MTFDLLHSRYLVAVSQKDRVTQEAVLKALHTLARTNSALPAWVIALGIKPAEQAKPPAAIVEPGASERRALERAIADAKAQRLLTPSAFGVVDDAALDGALALATQLHTVASQAIARLTAAALALRPAGPESPAHAAWRAKAAAIEPALARARAQSGQPGAAEAISMLYSTLPKEPPYDNNGGRASEIEQATALGAVVALLG